ncbi:MAG: C25 family cysteine peptidase, partial [Planctomycetota bacterium]
AFYPEKIVEVKEAGIMRGHRLMQVSFYPVQYNAASGVLRVRTNVSFEVTYQNADLEATERIQKRYASPAFEDILKEHVANYAPKSGRDAIPLPVGYLIITHTTFAAGIQALADWKDHIGFDVTVATTAQTGTTSSQIKAYIQNAYNTWVNPPQFVLFVGDSNFIPGFTGGETYSITDLDYSLMDSSDFLPDLLLGRFSVATTAQLQNVLDKVLGYEQADWTYSSWIKKACFLASVDNYTISEGTHNYVINNFLNPAGYASDKLYQVTYGATTQDVKNSLNNGRSLCVYSGHGSTTSWGDGPPFSQSDVNSLTNMDMYPVVCSHACLTGNYETTECFAETWQRAAGKGSVVFWGSSPSTYWDEDDILEKGMFATGFTDGSYHIAGMTNGGLMAVNNFYGGAGRTEYYYEAYHVFGEPSMLLRTEEPQNMDVTHASTITIGSAQLNVSVLLGGNPVQNALVHAAKDIEVDVTMYTDAAGNVTLPISSTTPGNMDLVVTSQNGIPYEGNVIVIVPTGPYVVLDDYAIDDTAGNNDGNIDIGESIGLDVAGKNVGIETSYGVTATLTTSDALITITDGTETFGDIAPDTIVWCADDFDFDVSPLCEDGHLASFTVTFTDTASNSWDYALNLVVNAPKVVYDSYSLDDVVGNGDGIADPGETLNFDVVLLNDGHHVAENVTIDIHTSDAYCNITQGSSAYANILPGNTASNSATLVAEILASTPVGHNVVVNADIYRNGTLVGTAQFSFIVSKIPVLIIDLDENHNSAPAMEATLTGFGVTYEKVQSWPASFDLYGSLFICLGIYSDNTELSSNQATALVSFMQAGGNVYMEGGDCWYYDDYADTYAPSFGIDGLEDGTSDTGTIVGQTGTIAHGLTYQYNGDNGWMDHLGALTGASLIFKNQSPSYGNGVAYDAGTHKAIGVSFEFGGLVDNTSTKADWMGKILEFLEIADLSLTADSATISEATGGSVNFSLNAAPENAGRNYYMLAGLRGSVPGTNLPGGKVLPLYWDFFTDLTITLWNTPYFVDFAGTLDINGEASAVLDTQGPLPTGSAGINITFAYLCTYKHPTGWFASNAVKVKIVP